MLEIKDLRVFVKDDVLWTNCKICYLKYSPSQIQYLGE